MTGVRAGDDGRDTGNDGVRAGDDGRDTRNDGVGAGNDGRGPGTPVLRPTSGLYGRPHRARGNRPISRIRNIQQIHYLGSATSLLIPVRLPPTSQEPPKIVILLRRTIEQRAPYSLIQRIPNQ